MRKRIEHDERLGSRTKMKIYDCVADFLLLNGYSPTVREICDITGLRSTSSVKNYLDELMMDGLITMQNASPRTIVVKGIRCIDERKLEKADYEPGSTSGI